MIEIYKFIEYIYLAIILATGTNNLRFHLRYELVLYGFIMSVS